jgi:hypothetical protein
MGCRSPVLVSAALVLLLCSPTPVQATPTEGRVWGYANAVAVITPWLAYSAMPGIRYEYSDSEGTAGGIAMYEFFTGPIFMHRIGPLTLKLPIWYYYMGFPVKSPGQKDKYFSSHNLEVIPIVEFKTGKWKLVNRMILHNKLFADNPVFDTKDKKRGHSLLLREMIRVFYSLSPTLSLTLAEEVFVGLLEDADTRKIKKGEPFFEKKGLSMNRLYAGVHWNFAPGFSVSPQYILETHHDPDDGLNHTRTRHYIFMTVNYLLKLF